MVPEDVYELAGATDPRVDPAGRHVAFVVWGVDKEENSYKSAIWLADLESDAAPRKYSLGKKRDGTPRWSPDGTRLSFVSGREEEASQLYVIPFGGGEPERITKLKEDVRDPAWSPDGKRIAFASRVREEDAEEEDDRKRKPRRLTRLFYKLDNEGWLVERRSQIFVVSADGSSEPVQLTEGDHENSSPQWSPRGDKLAFVSGRTEDWDIDLVSDIFLLDPGGGEPTKLTDSEGSVGTSVWSPDGTRIAFHYDPTPMDQPRHTQVAVVDVESGERRVLTESLDRTCGPYPDIREVQWDGDDILCALEDRGNVHLYRVPADGSRAPTPMIEGELTLRGWDLQNGTLVHVATTHTSFSELYHGDRRLTTLTDAFARERELVEPERFTATSADGTEVEAWLVRPVGFDENATYPVLLSIHGGPFTQYGSYFFDEFQVYAGAGYAVLFANPRGSSGYTEAWGRAIRGPSNDEGPGWGTVDYEDLMAVVDDALRRYDFLDAERMGVLGGSYGGFMTSWIVGHTDRFRAALSERAVNNLLSAYGSSDFFWAFKSQFGSWAFDDPDAWLRHSPWTYARDIETPLLIMHSEDDLRCNVEQGEILFITMRLLGKEVEFVRFPKESHELSRSGAPVHRVYRFEAILEWFDRHLKGESGRQPVSASASASSEQA